MKYRPRFATAALPRFAATLVAVAFLGLTACGGGGGSADPVGGTTTGGTTTGGTTTGGTTTGGGATTGGTGGGTTGGGSLCSGDDCRREVLGALGEQIILPALRRFDEEAAALAAATAALAASPTSVTARNTARSAWNAAMDAWQRNEVLQVGPAGRSTNPDAVAGGQDLRDLIYSWPIIVNACGLEQAAADGSTVDATTPINQTGLGAIEQLLYLDAAPSGCSAQPTAAQRSAHVDRLADWLAVVATTLRNRWEPASGNFLAQWSTAGAGSEIYSRPQDALNALSIALFYVDAETRDRKISYPAGLPSTGLVCSTDPACPEFLESRLSRRSGRNLIVNFEVYRDIFVGLNGAFGFNDLLIGIGRDDLATDMVTRIDNVLAALADIEADGGFDAAVEAIPDRTTCTNAFSNSSGLAPCALSGISRVAVDTFRGPIVGALSLAIPTTAAGDND